MSWSAIGSPGGSRGDARGFGEVDRLVEVDLLSRDLLLSRGEAGRGGGTHEDP